jgi:hypothetical protein
MGGRSGRLSLVLFGGAIGALVLLFLLTALIRRESLLLLVLFLASGASAFAGLLLGLRGLRRDAQKVPAAVGVLLNALYIALFIWSFLTRKVPV